MMVSISNPIIPGELGIQATIRPTLKTVASEFTHDNKQVIYPEISMPTCFVMQPFDGATFDRRFNEIFKPAIEAAGLEAYRVDQDPKVSIPIQEIESGIRDAQVCLADITRDNPNVWFELGFAIACNKQVVLICSDERESTKFPFDVQHRTIIKYPTKSPSDFTSLGKNITEKLTAYLEKSETLVAASKIPILAKIDGLDQYEIMTLAAIAQSLDHTSDHVAAGQIRRDMEANGATKIAAMIALKCLEEKGLAASQWRDGYNEEGYHSYELTQLGWQWIIENKARFTLEAPKKNSKSKTSFPDFETDDPF